MVLLEGFLESEKSFDDRNEEGKGFSATSDSLLTFQLSSLF